MCIRDRSILILASTALIRALSSGTRWMSLGTIMKLRPLSGTVAIAAATAAGVRRAVPACAALGTPIVGLPIVRSRTCWLRFGPTIAGTRSSRTRWVVTRGKFATSSHDTMTSLRVSPGAALIRIPPDALEALMSWTAMIAGHDGAIRTRDLHTVWRLVVNAHRWHRRAAGRHLRGARCVGRAGGRRSGVDLAVEHHATAACREAEQEAEQEGELHDVDLTCRRTDWPPSEGHRAWAAAWLARSRPAAPARERTCLL